MTNNGPKEETKPAADNRQLTSLSFTSQYLSADSSLSLLISAENNTVPPAFNFVLNLRVKITECWLRLCRILCFWESDTSLSRKTSSRRFSSKPLSSGVQSEHGLVAQLLIEIIGPRFTPEVICYSFQIDFVLIKKHFKIPSVVKFAWWAASVTLITEQYSDLNFKNSCSEFRLIISICLWLWLWSAVLLGWGDILPIGKGFLSRSPWNTNNSSVSHSYRWIWCWVEPGVGSHWKFSCIF